MTLPGRIDRSQFTHKVRAQPFRRTVADFTDSEWPTSPTQSGTKATSLANKVHEDTIKNQLEAASLVNTLQDDAMENQLYHWRKHFRTRPWRIWQSAMQN